MRALFLPWHQAGNVKGRARRGRSAVTFVLRAGMQLWLINVVALGRGTGRDPILYTGPSTTSGTGRRGVRGTGNP
jgi:hypothetical protein